MKIQKTVCGFSDIIMYNWLQEDNYFDKWCFGAKYWCFPMVWRLENIACMLAQVPLLSIMCTTSWTKICNNINLTWADQCSILLNAIYKEKWQYIHLIAKLRGLANLVTSYIHSQWSTMTNIKIKVIDMFCMMFYEDFIFIWHYLKMC